jgi:anti-sigma factor RsiW
MMRLFRFDDPEHGEANELLPWLVNGTLSGLERTRVERHVAECVACSQEVDSLRLLQAVVVHDDEVDRQANQALARVKARLQGPEGKPRATWALQSIGSQWRETNPWLRYAVVAQLFLVVGLTAALLHQPTPQYYRSLGAVSKPAVPESGLVVVFSEAVPERDVRDLLLRLHARIVDGPSPAGAYTLQVAQGDQAAALAMLRHTSSVVFAEPAPQSASSAR